MKKIILFTWILLSLSTSPLSAWSWPWSKAKTIEDKQLELQRKQIDDPTNPYINYNVGVAAYKKKQYDTASASFDRAIHNAPDKPIFKKQAHFNLGQAYYRQALATVGSSWQTAKLSDETIDKAIEQTVKSVKEFDAVMVLEAEHHPAKKMKAEVELFQQKLLAKKYENKDPKDKKDQKKDGQQNQQGQGQGGGQDQQQGEKEGSQSNQKDGNQQSGSDKSGQQGDQKKDGSDQKDQAGDKSDKGKEGQQDQDKDSTQDKQAQQGKDGNADNQDGSDGKNKQQPGQDPRDMQGRDNAGKGKKDDEQKEAEQRAAAGRHDKKSDDGRENQPSQEAGEEIPGSDVMDHALDAHAKSVLAAVEQAEGNAQKRAMAAELSKMRQASDVGGNQRPW